MSDNPPEVGDEAADEAEATTEEVSTADDPVARLASSVAETVGAESWSAEHGLSKIRVAADRWAESITTARDGAGLPHLEFLSAIDWSNDVEVGDPPEEPVEERFEVLCAIGDVVEARVVVFSTDLPKEDPRIESIEPVFPGAQWHEREAAEMYGITFEGLTNTRHLYLPDDFEGHPLRKSFALLSREVKPWPGDVDVEDLPERAPTGPELAEPTRSDKPSTENPGA
ncbi:MAG: NADH-quinone oxidoreductase subunit C [Acidimicrobiia bacterium]